jgi:outer membrane lipoprotein-sorting protein
MKNLICVVILASLLIGCATGTALTWQKVGASEADLKKDKYECSQESRVGGVTATDETRVFFYGQNKLSQVEANRLFRMCMEARGWATAEVK